MLARMRRLGWLGATLAFVASPAEARASVPNYAPLRAALAASRVPVLLPAQIPAELGPINSIAIIDVDPTGYYLGFSSVAHCAGALSCATLHVAGHRRRGAVAERPDSMRDRRLRLPDGTAAIYTPRDCSGAGCTEASLRFVRGDAGYEIDAKAGADAAGLLVRVYRQLRAIATPRPLHGR